MTPRLTPVDILNKRFSRRFFGYDSAEVDAVLQQIAADFEDVLLENAAQREQLAGQERELIRFRSLENTMRDALIMGQKAADELRDVARAQAAAQIEAATHRVESLNEQTERLRLDRRRMAHEMRALLESQMAWLDYEIAREAPQTAAGDNAAASAALSTLHASEIKPLSVVSPAEYAALTDTRNLVGNRLEIGAQDKTETHNGASDAVPAATSAETE